jgi:hypothetical protein
LDVADALATLFVALTVTRSVAPASAEASVYVAPVAPAIAVQLEPAELHLAQE